jgi:hypothetical protein
MHPLTQHCILETLLLLLLLLLLFLQVFNQW